jgi:hypothetical protein
VNVTSCPSTNEIPTPSSQNAAGAAKGKRRPGEEREHQHRDRGHSEPQCRARRVGRTAPEGYFECGLDRQQHDQHVEPVPAGERQKALHVSNVRHAGARRLLPK